LCRNCNTLQLLNHKIKYTYSSNFDYVTDIKTIRRIKSNSKSIINYIKRTSKRHSTLLDIGSGYGYFLKEASKNFNYSLGLEPSDNLYKYSVKKLKANVLKLSFEDYFLISKSIKFDVITMIHVIEHVKNPTKFINKAIKLLNRDGILYIETPNLNSWLFKVQQKKYTFLTPPDHTFIFSLESFKKILLKINTVNLYKLSTYSYIEHIVGVLKQLLRSTDNSKNNPTLKMTSFLRDRGKKVSFYKIKKVAFYLIFHKILGPIILPLLKLRYKGTFLRLYIRKNS
jgi:2-polyprenyl-3-methyl-5-hydroxy-6-metoxy-1,4-benzoquinol methylase